jgi:hypothetical protein
MRICILFLLSAISFQTIAQKISITILVNEIRNNQPLAQFEVKVNNLSYNTNSSGRVHLFSKQGTHQINIYDENTNFITSKTIEIQSDTVFNFRVEESKLLNTVTVTSKKEVISIHPTHIEIPQKTLETINLPMSSADPIHLLKTLPGISTAQEMNSNLFIRGASSYNTIIYMDNIPTPNLSHSFGLFSFFDLNVIRHIDYYDNQIPSEYGVRGSSFIKFWLKDPIVNKNHGEIMINPFFVTGNANIKLIDKKLGVFINYRKSIFNNEYNNYLPLFTNFSDLLIKTKYQINKKSNLSLIYTQNQDIANNDFGFGLSVNDSSFWRFRALSSQYIYHSNSGIEHLISSFYKSQQNGRSSSLFENYNLNNIFNELNFTYKAQKKLNNKFVMATGIENQIHTNQNLIDTLNEYQKSLAISSLFYEIKYEKERIELYGNIRGSYLFQLNKIFVEKRLNAAYKLKNIQVHAGLNNFINPIHSLYNNLFPIADDYRFLANTRFAPQIVEEIYVGTNISNSKKSIQFKSNMYHRNFRNSFDYILLYGNTLNSFENMTAMNHYSYGIENIANVTFKNKHSVTATYTFSRTVMQNDIVNSGLVYPTNYDRPHNLNLIHSFKYRRFNISSTLTIQSGRPTTIPLFKMLQSGAPVYSERNEERLPLFHKLDFGVQYRFKNSGKVKQFLNFHIYNIYMRQNVYAILFWESETSREYTLQYLTLFPILPTFNYTIKF